MSERIDSPHKAVSGAWSPSLNPELSGKKGILVVAMLGENSDIYILYEDYRVGVRHIRNGKLADEEVIVGMNGRVNFVKSGEADGYPVLTFHPATPASTE